ncbi:MAG TPA: HD domain-containing phosphohydrolase [Candidatus Elarobacter sp.]|nr:HD domain-containing phosphohydrolase [Candidatus Elarobacter sp.]
MSESLVQPAAPARLAGAIERPRVAEALRRATRRSVTLVIAPAGFGKSAAVGSIAGAAVCRLPAVPRSLAEVALAIGSSLAPDRRGIEAGVAGSVRGAAAGEEASALAAWLAGLAPGGGTVVLDDLDDALALPGVGPLVVGLVDRTAHNVRWVLAARSPDAFPVARWMADGLAGVPVDEAVLGLQPDEVRRIRDARGVERAALPNVEMRLATVALACDLLDAGAPRRALASHARSLQHAAQLAFEQAGEAERELLALAVHLPALGEAVLRELPLPDAAAVAARVRARLASAFDARGVATWLRAALRERIAGDPRYAGAAAAASAARDRANAHAGAPAHDTAARAELQRAALALQRGDVDDADAAARGAIALAEDADAYDVAARASAVLEELARDAGEPAAEMAALEQLERFAALAGEHELRAFALTRAHAHLAEHGDADGMRAVEAAFAFLAPAVEERTRRASAGGRALALAWSGDFAAAHALLAGAPAAASDAAGRALRAAEVACYAAAAHLRAESHDAAGAAENDLYQVTESATRDRVLALLGLAATLSGDDEAAHRRLPRTPAGEASRRTAVLLDAVIAYRRCAHGEASPLQLAGTLERTRRRGFGGFARLIEALADGARHGAGDAADAVDVAIERLLGELDAHDPASGVHTRAVGSWCARIAERLGLDAAEVVHVRRCGLLHDVGKARVPLALLAAPRALDPAERVLMEAHAVFGEHAVLAVETLTPFASAVRSHHERYDGRGYPDRLVGERIPRAARIVSVADAFDAMIASRPYRAPRTPSAALLELHRERGRQFDPEIVDAMIAVVEGHG